MLSNEKGLSSNTYRARTWVVLLTVGLIAVLAVFFYIRHTRIYVSTDDAYVTGRIHTVAPKVAGTVTAVRVEDNQQVFPGDVLVELDAADYEARYHEAEAALDAERSRLAEYTAKAEAAEEQLKEAQARVESARAGLALAEANYRQAASDHRRAEGLYEKGVVSESSYEKAKTAFDVAQAQRNAAHEQLMQAQAYHLAQKKALDQARLSVRTQTSVVAQKEKTLEIQRLALSYTKIVSPARGYVTRKNVEAGNFVSAGQPLMTIVGLDDVWIVANYKETQLTRVRPGQKVTIRVDTYPDKTFSGKVDSIMAGTGSVFSLFPPENATGNFVKVVQRIPVKIVLEKASDPDHVLRVGMSVVPTIRVVP